MSVTPFAPQSELATHPNLCADDSGCLHESTHTEEIEDDPLDPEQTMSFTHKVEVCDACGETITLNQDLEDDDNYDPNERSY